MLRINDVYELDEKKYRILKVYTDHIIWIELEKEWTCHQDQQHNNDRDEGDLSIKIHVTSC